MISSFWLFVLGKMNHGQDIEIILITITYNITLLTILTGKKGAAAWLSWLANQSFVLRDWDSRKAAVEFFGTKFLF
jgi:hypothetical protein